MSYKVIAKAIHIRGKRYEKGTTLPEEITEDVKDLPSVKKVDDGKLSGKQISKPSRKRVQGKTSNGYFE